MQIYVSPNAEYTLSTSMMNERQAKKKKRLLTRWLKKGMGEEEVINVQMREFEGDS